MRRPLPALRLRLRWIETKPKPVYLERWADYAAVKKRPELQDELLDIIASIERGDGVPEYHYPDPTHRKRFFSQTALWYINPYMNSKSNHRWPTYPSPIYARTWPATSIA